MEDRDFFISLLEDEDESNASIAMKELLARGEADSVIAECMDTDSPLMRRRIQELACISNYRRMKAEFPKRVLDESLSPWECLSWINVIMDFRTSLPQLDGMVRDYLEEGETIRGTGAFIRMIKETGIGIDDSCDHYITKFLLSDVMVHNTGDSLPVAVIIQRLGDLAGWHTRLGTVNGIMCLKDRYSNFILVTAEMEKVLVHKNAFRPMSLRELAVDELSKILSSAEIDQIATVVADSQELLEKILPQ